MCRLKVGDFVTHFKRNAESEFDFNHCYRILAVGAKHTETDESLLVYQAMYGNHEVFCRPLDMALERVDRVKYPTATQIYRFEVVKDFRLLTALQSRLMMCNYEGYEEKPTESSEDIIKSLSFLE